MATRRDSRRPHRWSSNVGAWLVSMSDLKWFDLTGRRFDPLDWVRILQGPNLKGPKNGEPQIRPRQVFSRWPH